MAKLSGKVGASALRRQFDSVPAPLSGGSLMVEHEFHKLGGSGSTPLHRTIIIHSE